MRNRKGTADSGHMTEEPRAWKARTRGSEVEVDGAICPSTVILLLHYLTNDMLPLLLHHLTNEWKPDLSQAGVQLTPPLTAIQVGAAAGTARKVSFLVFSAGDTCPSLILKVTRHVAHQKWLRQEHELLCQVNATFGPDKTIPQPVGLFMVHDHLIMVETSLPGMSLAVQLRRYQRWRKVLVQDDFQRVQAWLAQFQRSTAVSSQAFAGKTAVDVYLAHRSPQTLPPSFITNLRAQAKAHTDLMIPRCGQHGDFWPGNLFLDDDSIGVIDWEDFKAEANPFRDLFLFMTTYALTYPWGKWRRWSRGRRFCHAFTQTNWFSRLLAQTAQVHWQQMGLPLSSISLFYALFLLEMAAPVESEGAKRQQQAGQWLDLLQLYAHHELDSIFK